MASDGPFDMEERLAWIGQQLDEADRVRDAVARLAPELAGVAERIASALRGGARIFFFGNGGSAADAQHWAAELSGRFTLDRPPLPAIALGTSQAEATAIANDHGYEEVFARPLAALADAGDVAVGISTSGRSPNVLRALAAAREAGLVTIGFTGASGGGMAVSCDVLFRIPSEDTARVQEGHELCGHLLCAMVERLVFGSPDVAGRRLPHALDREARRSDA